MQVGWIGLGTMGAAMAANLQAAGRQLVVHDRDRDRAASWVARGAEVAEDPMTVATRCEVVLLSLPGPPEVTSVLTGDHGILAADDLPDTVIDLSTNSWTTVKTLAAATQERGTVFLDAPVSGGPAGARDRKLAIWAGGDRDAFDRHRSVLDAIADRVRHVGPTGAGTVVKLTHNATGNTVMAALADLFAVATEAGVEPLTLWAALRDGAVGRRRTFDGLANQFLPGRYDPANLTVDLAAKDTSLALELAEDVGLPLVLLEEVADRFAEVQERGWGQRDSRVAMTLALERLQHHPFEPTSEADLRAVLEADAAAGS